MKLYFFPSSLASVALSYSSPTNPQAGSDIESLQLSQRPVVVRQIVVALRGGRLAAPVALDLGAQREHVPEAFHVDPRIGREAELRIGEQLPGARGDFRGDLQPLAQDADRGVLVGGRYRPARARDDAGDVALERIAVGSGPAAQNERAARLVGPDEVHRAAQALQARGLGVDRERRVEHRRLVVLVLAHSLEAQAGAADRMDPVVGALLQAVHEEDLL